MASGARRDLLKALTEAAGYGAKIFL